MSGKIVLAYSSNWELLTHTALAELPKTSEPNYSWIYLSQDYLRADYLSKRYMELTAAKTIIAPPVYSWYRFLETVYNHLPISAPLLKLQEQLFVLYRVLQNKKDKLNYFLTEDKPFSAQVVKSIQLIINAALMQYPTQEEIEDESFRQELDLIIDEYRLSIQDRFMDEPGLLRWIIENINIDQLKKIFPSGQRLVWEVDTPIYPLQLEVAKKLDELGWEVSILLHYDDHPDFFANMDDTYRQIVKIAGKVRRIEDPLKLTSSLYRLNDSKLSMGKGLTLAKYPDRINEVEEIAKQIKRDLIDNKLSAEQIVVAAPDISQYLPLLINTLRAYGVAYTVSHPMPLSDLLPLQHLQLFLELISENGDLSVLKRFLKSPFFQYNDDLKGIPFEEILNGLRVQGSLKIIMQQLEKSIAYDEGIYDEQEEVEEYDIDNKKRLLEVLKTIENEIEPITTSFSADEFFRFFNDLLSQHKIVDRILGWRDFLASKNLADILGAVRAFGTGLDLWRNVVNRVEPEPQFPVDAARDIFKLIINNYHYQFQQPLDYGVQILPLNALESSAIDTLYVLGLTDNSFPRTNRLLFYNLPQPLSKLLPNHQLLDDRRMFLKLLQNPKHKVHLSFPEREGESLNVSSNLMLELERLSGEKIVTPKPAPVFSKSEILMKMPGLDKAGRPEDIPQMLFDDEQLFHFKRQINIVKGRNDITRPFGIYEGELSSEKTITDFLNHYFETKEFSVSALELYAKTPIQYFFRKVLYVDEPEMFEDWITPLEKGKMVHNVLYRFYGQTSEEQRTLAKLLEIAEDEIERFPFLLSILWNLQREAFLGSESIKGLFPAFHEYEQLKLEATRLKPERFEVLFGNFGKRISSKYADRFPQSFEIKNGDDSLKLRGIVDRIEFSAEGGIIIVDYKTGEIPSFKKIKQGISLQLPLYLQAVSYFLKNESPSYYPLGACYYQVKNQKEIKKEILFVEGKHSLDAKMVFPNRELGNKLREVTLREFLEQINSFAIRYAKGIRYGKFQHHWDIGECINYQKDCPFEPLCRVNRAKLRNLQNYGALK